MPARNHVTTILSADPVAKASTEVKDKVKAEVAKPDPKAANDVLKANEIDGNGSGAKFTTKPAKEAQAAKAEEGVKEGGENPNTVLDQEEKRVKAGGKSDEQLQKDASQGEKDTPTEKHLEVTKPKTSQETGKNTTTKVEHKDKK